MTSAVSAEAVEAAARALACAHTSDGTTMALPFELLPEWNREQWRALARRALDAVEFHALVARCAELEGENERLKWTLNSEQLRADQLLKDRQAAEREAEALRADAERYRWLRNAGYGDYLVQAQGLLWNLAGSSRRKLDEAIDAARAGGQEDGHGK